MSESGRFCCKSLFALTIKISFGCTGDFHVNMWGTSLSEEKLAGDPSNVIEATSIGGRRLDFFTAGKLAPGNFGLLQQYRSKAERLAASIFRPDYPQEQTSSMPSGSSEMCHFRTHAPHHSGPLSDHLIGVMTSQEPRSTACSTSGSGDAPCRSPPRPAKRRLVCRPAIGSSPLCERSGSRAHRRRNRQRPSSS
jgi:hypothetical protein